MKRRDFLALAAVAPAALAADSKDDGDVILRAMRDEIERSRTLRIASLDDPYYIEYTLEDVQGFSTAAALGALLNVSESRFRVPKVRVRVGDPKFDNTNYILSDFYTGSRYDPEQFPIDDDYTALRRGFWLATDRAFKTAVEAITRKRAALKNITQAESLPDFWPNQSPVKRLEAVPPFRSDRGWTERVKALSETFAAYPEVLSSSVSFNSSRSVFYLQTSEGATVRRPDPSAQFQVQAAGFAPDGTTIRDSFLLPAIDDRSLPPQPELRKAVVAVAENVRALMKAPVGENYSGPVLFEGIAGPQVIAEVLAPNLVVGRRPVGEPGRPVPFLPSEFEGRIESRVLPEFLDVIDDPTLESWKGTPLLGSFAVDEEGVIPKPLTVVSKGKLKVLLLTRQPVKGFQGSNGRARLPGSFGAHAAAISNLVVRSSEAMSTAELKKKLIELAQARSKPYGIIIRKMDFPSTASQEEVRKLMMAAGQSGSARPVSAPLLAFRVYADGREELVRGLRFRGLNSRALRDIMAVSEESSALHYMNNMAPFALSGAAQYVAPSSVIAPSLLFDELELEKPQDDLPKLPVVPPPPLTGNK